MAQAAELARRTHPHPNPKVGAVVLNDAGEIVGRGSHVGPGSAHAEVVALAQAGESGQGSTVVVTSNPVGTTGELRHVLTLFSAPVSPA
jgi:diaminohydroxyphosphoribosylaminopyrimidine deaminase/5-amino-6-(5-phosphoribosylamino)uracil reductase